jgi:hypothetical protein
MSHPGQCGAFLYSRTLGGVEGLEISVGPYWLVRDGEIDARHVGGEDEGSSAGRGGMRHSNDGSKL